MKKNYLNLMEIFLSDIDRKISLIKAENSKKFNLAILDDGLQEKNKL